MNETELLLEDLRPEALPALAETPDVGTLIPAIRRRHGDRITGELVIPARAGTYAEFPDELEPALVAALRSPRHPAVVQPPARGVGCASAPANIRSS